MFYAKDNSGQKRPAVPFKKIYLDILKDQYELSLVFVDSKFSKSLNSRYRKKNKPTNVLSFPLSKDSGEIFLDLELIRKEAKEQERKFPEYLAYIFIHGLLHLKGYGHGSRMEKEENKILAKFF